LPTIDPNTRTLLLCGYPNVGKSSFINKVGACFVLLLYIYIYILFVDKAAPWLTEFPLWDLECAWEYSLIELALSAGP
jgi:hypothetical protein